MKSTTYERASGTIHISLLQFPCNRVGLILGNDLSPVVLSNKSIVCARRQAQATGLAGATPRSAIILPLYRTYLSKRSGPCVPQRLHIGFLSRNWHHAELCTTEQYSPANTDATPYWFNSSLNTGINYISETPMHSIRNWNRHF